FYRPQLAGLHVTAARPVWYMSELRPAR
ncbi:MAG: hypothetical protein QOD48_1303, partial [Gaiellaceae bacterium]|nr:hypothetical protein [Gaiellaceae bacterium]